jgi:hypothetical protein
VNYAGVSLPDHTHYAIPGAEIPLSAIVADLREEALFTHEPEAHTMHMLEVELPFLHQLRGRPQEADFAIVPMILGRMDGDAVQRLAEILDSYADPETLFVFSVDLSHFYPDQKARALDHDSIQAVMSRNRQALARAETDGNRVLETLLALAERRGWEPTFLMSRNSGDVSGDKSRVVGYASIVFHEPFSLTEQEQRELLSFTRRCIEEHVRDGRAREPEAEWLERYPIFRIPRAVFVTLEKRGRLRGSRLPGGARLTKTLVRGRYDRCDQRRRRGSALFAGQRARAGGSQRLDFGSGLPLSYECEPARGVSGGFTAVQGRRHYDP